MQEAVVQFTQIPLGGSQAHSAVSAGEQMPCHQIPCLARNGRVQDDGGLDRPPSSQAALRQLIAAAPDLLSAVMEASPDTISIADATRPDMPLLYVNPAFTRTTGYAAEEVIGKNCRFLQGPLTDPKVVKTIADGLKARSAVDVELLNYRKDGQAFLNALKLTPIFGRDGKLMAYLGIQRDITEVKIRAERDRGENRLEALGLASGTLAHQMNNLLQPVVSLLALHGPSLPSAEAREDLETALQSTLQAAEMSNSLLLLTKGTAEGQTGLTTAGAALERAEKLLRILIPAPVRLKVDLDRLDRSVRLPVSETNLFQVLLNTVQNAAQAMDNAGCIVLEANTETAGTCRINVSDHGPGIEKNDRERVFKPFFTTRETGSGLGLSVVRTIVAAAGGDVSIADGLPNGAPRSFGCRFQITFPAY